MSANIAETFELLFDKNNNVAYKSYTWDGFIDMLKVYPLAKPKIYVRLF